MDHFDKTMSVRFLVGAKEDYVRSGAFEGYMRFIRPHMTDFECPAIPDADHFFLLEKREEALKILHSWIDTPVTKPAVKKRAH